VIVFAELEGNGKNKGMRNPTDGHLSLRSLGDRVVFTNGCFDILHAGHVDLLRKAKERGDVLAVGINSDESVRALKGPTRPINSAFHRANLLRELRSVDYVFIFDDVRVASILRNHWPHVWVKGGDYTIDTLDKMEVEAAKAAGVEIVIIPAVPGLSTTGILSKV
jgi:rfaE bifunctional protein nucleotidyltransferase chain/domain